MNIKVICACGEEVTDKSCEEGYNAAVRDRLNGVTEKNW